MHIAEHAVAHEPGDLVFVQARHGPEESERGFTQVRVPGFLGPAHEQGQEDVYHQGQCVGPAQERRHGVQERAPGRDAPRPVARCGLVQGLHQVREQFALRFGAGFLSGFFAK